MKKIVIVMVLLTVCLFGVLIFGTKTTTVPAEKLDLSSARPVAPEFQLNDINNKQVTLSAQRGKVVILNFWATWCPPCREEIPSMNRLHKIVQNLPVEIIAVNIEADGQQTVPKFMQKQQIDFRVLYDLDGAVHTQYGVSKYPETFIIDPQGIVVNKVIGGTDWSDPRVVDYLNQLLSK